jgi:hypothetical protein
MTYSIWRSSRSYRYSDSSGHHTVLYTLELPNGKFLAFEDPETSIEGWGDTATVAIHDLVNSTSGFADFIDYRIEPIK